VCIAAVFLLSCTVLEEIFVLLLYPYYHEGTPGFPGTTLVQQIVFLQYSYCCAGVPGISLLLKCVLVPYSEGAPDLPGAALELKGLFMQYPDCYAGAPCHPDTDLELN
jgi:hypothetical protein